MVVCTQNRGEIRKDGEHEKVKRRKTKKMPRKKNAFTLIELLVVIAIVALLLAILGPSLGKAKDQVRDTICRSNLKQWALVFALYANDNENSFPQSVEGNEINYFNAHHFGAFLPYYEDLDLRVCPSTKSLGRSPSSRNMGSTFTQWGPFLLGDGSNWWHTYAEGSYGINDWVANPPLDRTEYLGIPCANAVRTTFAKNAYMIPMVYDSVFSCTATQMNDLAPSNTEHEMDLYNAWWYFHDMKLMCIDRHKGGINAAFVDMDVRHVGIKELWLLKWHKNWKKCQPPNAWPTWTDNYKNY
jgi:prepilin-type N-terminal cleavage/methylation domain-containing protein